MRFYEIFFGTTGFQQKLLILIESPNIFHWKSTKKESRCYLSGQIWGKKGPMLRKNKETVVINGLFSVVEKVVIEIPEWRLKAKIARKTTFEEN